MSKIEINVVNRRCVAATDVVIVCNNADYELTFNFDSEWRSIVQKTLRVAYDGKYEDVEFEGNTVTMPPIPSTRLVHVGVYAGIMATVPVDFVCEKSIISDAYVRSEPVEDVYNTILAKLNEIANSGGTVESAMQSVREELLGEMSAVETQCNNKVDNSVKTVNDTLAERKVKSGDTVTIANGFFDGYASSDKKTVYIRVPIAKSLEDVTSAAITAVTATFANTSTKNTVATGDVKKIDIDKATNCVFITLNRSTAYSVTAYINLYCTVTSLSLEFE